MTEASYRSSRLASDMDSSLIWRSKLKRRLSTTTRATNKRIIHRSQPVSSHTFSAGVSANTTARATGTAMPATMAPFMSRGYQREKRA